MDNPCADIARELYGPKMNVAELLLKMVEATGPKSRIVLVPTGVKDHSLGLSRMRLAFDFAKRDKGFILKAVFEEWDLGRIVREMY